jgi:hypothetical protein
VLALRTAQPHDAIEQAGVAVDDAHVRKCTPPSGIKVARKLLRSRF